MNTPQSTKAPSAHKEARATPTATRDEWWQTFNAAARAELNGDTKAVLVALLSYSNGPGHERPLEDARPGIDRLMKATGLSRRPVQKKLRELEALGWLHTLDEGGTRGSNATSYRVALPSSVAVEVVLDDALESRGVPSDAPGAFLETPLGRSQRRPTVSVPTHSPTHLPHVQTAPPPAASRSVDKHEESKGRAPSKLHPDAVRAWQSAAERWGQALTEDDLVALRRHLGPEFAEWLDENGKRPPKHCAASAGIDEDGKGPHYRAAASLWSLMAQARTEGIAVMRQPAPPEESRTIRVDAADRAQLEDLDAQRAQAIAEGTLLPEFVELSRRLDKGHRLEDLDVVHVLEAEEAPEEEGDELARQSAGLAEAIAVQDRQERAQAPSAAPAVPAPTDVENGRESATEEVPDPFKAAALRADRRHTRRRIPPGADLVQMHRDRLAGEAAA